MRHRLLLTLPVLALAACASSTANSGQTTNSKAPSSTSGSIPSSADAAEAGRGALDLVLPHDDVALCAAFDSRALASAIGGREPVSFPGANAEQVERIQTAGGAFPMLGSCRVPLSDESYVGLQVVDLTTPDKAAEDHEQRRDGMEDYSVFFSSIDIEPGVYLLTEGSVMGYTGRFSVACNVTVDDGLNIEPGDFTPAIEAACLKAVAELSPLLL